MQKSKINNMTIVRAPHESCYTVLSNTFARSCLSLKARGLYCTIMSLPDDWSFSQSGLRTLVNASEYALGKAIEELKQAGFCRVTRCSDSTQFAYCYTFYEEPLTDIPSECDEDEIIENQRAEIPSTEIPSAKNPTAKNSTTEIPTAKNSTTEIPTTEIPTTEIPTTEIPTAEIPTAENPSAENQGLQNNNRQNNNRQSTDGQTTDRQNKERQSRESSSAETMSFCEHIVGMFNDICTDLAPVALDDFRAEKLMRLVEQYDPADIEQAFRTAQDSDFLTARDGGRWCASFDWLIVPSNMKKVLSGYYRSFAAPRRAAPDPYAGSSYYSSQREYDYQYSFPSGRFPSTFTIEEVEELFAAEEKRLFAQLDDPAPSDNGTDNA